MNDNNVLQSAVIARQILRQPYSPPVWAFSSWVQLLIYVAKSLRRPKQPGPWDRQLLTLPDGGTVALDWYRLSPAAAPPPDAPVLLLLHTITGTSREFAPLAAAAAALGWRPVVCLRRGHLGAALTSPKANLLGCTDDLRAHGAPL